jgi:hypothetical protein
MGVPTSEVGYTSATKSIRDMWWQWGKKYCKMGGLSDLEIGQIVGALLAGAPVTITATLLVVL